MDLIINLIVGGIIGWLASVVMKTNNQMGVIANVIVGIIGSGLGAWVFSLVGLAAYGDPRPAAHGRGGRGPAHRPAAGPGFYK